MFSELEYILVSRIENMNMALLSKTDVVVVSVTAVLFVVIIGGAEARPQQRRRNNGAAGENKDLLRQ